MSDADTIRQHLYEYVPHGEVRRRAAIDALDALLAEKERLATALLTSVREANELAAENERLREKYERLLAPARELESYPWQHIPVDAHLRLRDAIADVVGEPLGPLSAAIIYGDAARAAVPEERG